MRKRIYYYLSDIRQPIFLFLLLLLCIVIAEIFILGHRRRDYIGGGKPLPCSSFIREFKDVCEIDWRLNDLEQELEKKKWQKKVSTLSE